jgi:hypothetical protein
MRWPPRGCWPSWSPKVEGTPPAPIAASAARGGRPAPTPSVSGDSAYGTGPLLASLHAAGIDPRVKVQAAVAPRGHFTKTSSGSTLAPAPSLAPHSAPARSCTAPIQATAITARPASLRRARAARFAANALARPAVEPSPSPPTSTSWRLRVSARPSPPAPPTTGRPAQGRAETRPSGPPPPRRPPPACPRPGQSRRRLQLLAAAVNLGRLGVLRLRWTPSDGWAAA